MKANGNKLKEWASEIQTKPTASVSPSSSVSSPEKMEKSKSSRSAAAAVVWDCGSSLYDSFELNSLKRQLDSAIASRTLSMPHLPSRRSLPPPPSKRPSKISRSLHKFLRSVFRQKPNSSPTFEDSISGFSPEIASLVRRTASERFTASTSVGISCV